MLKQTSFAVLLSIVASTSTVVRADEAKGGFWCWAHQDGTIAICWRARKPCVETRAAFNETARVLKQEPIKAECTWQKTTWEHVTKQLNVPRDRYPTKKLCTKRLEAGETCRLVQ